MPIPCAPAFLSSVSLRRILLHVSGVASVVQKPTLNFLAFDFRVSAQNRLSLGPFLALSQTFKITRVIILIPFSSQ